jgi:transcriptional regulator with XRE-family HTH domain
MLSITEQTGATQLLSDYEQHGWHAAAMSVADVIRKKRAERKLSQRGLAALLGLSHGAIAQWELGQTYPDPVRRSMLSVVLGVDAEALQPGGTPEDGELVKRPDELALLGFYRTLDEVDRASFLRVLFAARRTGADLP